MTKFGFNSKVKSRLDLLVDDLANEGIKPSKAQFDIFDFCLNGSGHGVIGAAPGSGKSTTIEWCTRIMNNRNVLVLAFNKHIQLEMNDRLESDLDCLTTYAAGGRMLGKRDIDRFKYHKLVAEKIKFYFPRVCAYEYKYDQLRLNDVGRALQKDIMQFINLRRLTLIEDLYQLAEHCSLPLYGLQMDLDDLIDQENDERISQATRKAVRDNDLKFCADSVSTIKNSGRRLLGRIINETLLQGIGQYLEQRIIDFADMIYLPVKLNYKPRWQYDFIFIDEFQDLNMAQLEIAMKLLKPNGRVLAVGDKNQAIYAFTGAMQDSMQIAAERLQATELPLYETFRCPKSHVELAKSIYPEIEAADNAIEGEWEVIDQDKMIDQIIEGDLIVGRKTAPLVDLTLKLIGRGLPAKLRGRDVSKELIGFSDKVMNSRLNANFRDFLALLNEYTNRQIDKLAEDDYTEDEQETLLDLSAAVSTIYFNMNHYTYDEFKANVESLFTEKRAAIWLSTVHRAKGLEGPRIWVYGYNEMPMTWKGQKEHQLIQETNLKFIAITRSKKWLGLVYVE